MIRDLFRAPWLLDPRTFGGDDSGGGGGGDSGGGGGSSDSGSSSQATEKQTIGQVSSTGQYAGDGFEWVENEGGYLTRTYTGEGKDNGLGTDVRTGGTEDKPVKEAIAAISLNQTNKPETVFGETKGSSTDGSLLDLFRAPEDQVGSASYAEQIGYQAPKKEQTFDEAFAENRAAGNKTFTWNGNQYTTDLAPEPEPEEAAPAFDYTMGVGEPGRGGAAEMTVVDQVDTSQPLPEPEPEPVFSYDMFGNQYTSAEDAAAADTRAAEAQTAAEALIQAAADKKKAAEAAQAAAAQAAEDRSARMIAGRDLGADLGIGMSSSPVTAEQLQTGADTVTLPTLSGGSLTVSTDLDSAIYDDILADISDTGDISAATMDKITAGGAVDDNRLRVGDPMTEQLATELGFTYFDGDTLTSEDIMDLASKGFDVNTGSVVDFASGSDVGRITLNSITSPQQQPDTTSQLPFSGNLYGADSPYRAEMLQNLQTAAPTTDVDLNFPLGRPEEPDSAAGRYLASGMAQAGQLIGTLGETVGEYLDPTTAPIGYEEGEVDYRLAEAAGATPGATAMQTGEEPSEFTQASRDLAERMANIQDRVEAGLSPEERAALTADIISPYTSELGRPGLSFDMDAFTAQGLKSAPSTVAGLSGAIAGPVGLGITGGAMTGAEVGYEAGEKVEREAIARGYSPEEAQAMRIEAQKAGTAYGVPIGVASNLLFARIVPGSGKSVIGQTAKNMGEEGFTEGYVEQNVAALATDPLLGQQTAGTQFSPNEAILGAAGAGIATPVLSGAQTPSLDVTKSPTFGQPAQSTVTSAYDSGALSGEQLLQQRLEDSIRQTGGVSSDLVEELNATSPEKAASMITEAFDNVDTSRASSVEFLAAQSVVDDLVSQYGPTIKADTDTGMGIPRSELERLSDATGLGFMELSSMIENSTAPITLNQDLRVDQPASTDVSQIPSRLTLTSAESVEPTTPDLSGIASNITFQPTAADQAVTSKMDADASAPLQTAAADAAKAIDAAYSAAVDTPGFFGRVKDAFTGLTEAQAKAGSKASSQAIDAAVADLQNTYNITEDEARDAVLTAVEERIRAANEDLDSKTFLDILKGNTKADPDKVLSGRDTDADVAAEVEIEETTETPVFTSVRAEPETTETPVFSTVRDPNRTVEVESAPESQVSPETEVEVESAPVVEDEQVPVAEEPVVTEDAAVTVNVPVDTVVPDEDFTPEIEDDEEPEDTDTGVTVEVDEPDGDFVAPITTTDDDGNEITECPEGYQLVEGPDGPTCQKSVQRTRQRAGRGLQAYTNLALRAGETGPGQKKKTTTVTQRTAPITRRT